VPAKTYVVRATASYVDFIAKVSKRMPWLILAVVVLAFILLTVAFRSIVIATKAAVFILLSVGAAYWLSQSSNGGGDPRWSASTKNFPYLRACRCSCSPSCSGCPWITRSF
jgi:uncharacterized membrane protein YdfJ with MMPL/SSD domain